jgi:hypothetical protein
MGTQILTFNIDVLLVVSKARCKLLTTHIESSKHCTKKYACSMTKVYAPQNAKQCATHYTMQYSHEYATWNDET